MLIIYLPCRDSVLTPKLNWLIFPMANWYKIFRSTSVISFSADSLNRIVCPWLDVQMQLPCRK